MVMTIDWTIIPEFLPVFMKGLQTTLLISVISIALGFIGGILIGMCRISRNRLVYGASTVYVEAFRGTPLLIQIFLIYLGLPQLGIYVDSPLVAGLIALSLNSAAYQSEIFRGGVQSISVGQIEAARSLGMTYNQALFNVVIPQALRNALPPYTPARRGIHFFYQPVRWQLSECRDLSATGNDGAAVARRGYRPSGRRVRYYRTS